MSGRIGMLLPVMNAVGRCPGAVFVNVILETVACLMALVCVVNNMNKDSESEPHEIVQCVVCGEAKKLEFRRDGDDELYYICHSCGFESQPLGPAPYYIK